MESDPDQDQVKVTKPYEGITVITINREHRRNAVDAATARKLYAAVTAFEDDDSQKVAVLHGASGTFCAGYDLHTIGSGIAHYDKTNVSGTLAPMGPSRLQIKKPILTAVSGYAVAGGLELSLLGDMRIVEEDAVFGVFCRRWGVPLIDGGTVRLQAVVGLGRALDMILTGRSVNAQEALAMGLADRIVPKGKALNEALKIAQQLRDFPQIYLSADRTSCYNACYNARSFDDAMKFEMDGGLGTVDAEGAAGAKRFSKGSGRHGNFAKL